VEFLPALATIARTVDGALGGLYEDDFIGLAAPHDVYERLVDLEDLERYFVRRRCLYLVEASAPTEIDDVREEGESEEAGSLPEETAELIIACLRSDLTELCHGNSEYVAPC
jgi:hypothetical protein